MKKIRDKILETAGDLFQRRGYTCVGINEIIETSGVSKAGFYDNFASKEILCVEWLQTTHKRSEQHHANILAETGSSAQKVVDYFHALADFMACREYRGCPFSNTASVIDAKSPRIHAEIESHKIFIREFFVDLATEIVPEGNFEELGNHLFLLYSGAATEAQNLRSEWPISTAARIAKALTEHAQRPSADEQRRKEELLAV
ncbi:MAG: TetR/AcrR family transcriptional regulator [Verrucomicrobiota bacterium]